MCKIHMQAVLMQNAHKIATCCNSLFYAIMCETVCVLSAGSRFDRLIIKTVSERMSSVFKECLVFVCVMTPMGHIRQLHIREFKQTSFSPLHTLFFYISNLDTSPQWTRTWALFLYTWTLIKFKLNKYAHTVTMPACCQLPAS